MRTRGIVIAALLAGLSVNACTEPPAEIELPHAAFPPPGQPARILVVDGHIIEGRVPARLVDGKWFLGEHQILGRRAGAEKDSIAITDSTLRSHYMSVAFIATRAVGGMPLSRAVNQYYTVIHGHLRTAGTRYQSILRSQGQARARAEAGRLVRNDSLGLGATAQVLFNDCGGGEIVLPTIGPHLFSCADIAPAPMVSAEVSASRLEEELAAIRGYMTSKQPVVIIYSKGGRSVYSGPDTGVAIEVLHAAGYPVASIPPPRAGPGPKYMLLAEQLAEIRAQRAAKAGP